MRDRLGKELKIGDYVVHADGRYANLYVGTVIGFTPKMVRVQDRTGSSTLKTSSQVAIVEPKHA